MLNDTESGYARNHDTKRFAELEVSKDQKSIICGLCGNKVCDFDRSFTTPDALAAATEKHGHCCKACASAIHALNVSGVDLGHIVRIVKNMVASSVEQHYIYEHTNG